MNTIVLRDPRFLEHDPGPGHPEGPHRLHAIEEDLDARPVPGTVAASPRAATLPELGRVHGEAYVHAIARTQREAHVRLDPDTATSPGSYEAALHAAGAVLQATEAVTAAEASGAFALVRPPGHHAEASRAMGFCLFNNVAVAAAHAVAACGCRRVLVLDPDVHHGNGTQHAFWGRSDVLYASSHRFPFYPGTGAVDEIGDGDGRGFTVNLPLPGGSGDADLLHLYDAVLAPIVASWRPDLILVSAGFDTWKHDPIGGMAMTAEGYAALFSRIRRWADEHCPGRLVFALEGGYDPEGLRVGVRTALEVLTGARAAPSDPLQPPSAAALATAARARRLLAPHWPVLRADA